MPTPSQEVKVVAQAHPAVAAVPPPRPVQPASRSAPVPPDAREAVLARLRREAPPRADAQTPPRGDRMQVAARVPLDEPRVTSARQRLMDARTALVGGRTDEARHLLEEAQLQLVFRPVGTPQDTGQGSNVAAGQVAEALSMLGAGDVLHAIRYINLAVSQTDRGPPVANAVPSPYAGLPPPVPYGDDYANSR
jgi:hypothetical protein